VIKALSSQIKYLARFIIMLDAALEPLKSYNWGADRNVLKPLDDAVIASRGDRSASQELESRLAAMLATDVSRDAKDVICRKLMLIGTAASVPALASMLSQEENSHMARYALERIPAPEAAKSLRDALAKLSGKLKIGVISSLGARQDTESIQALSALVNDPDAAIASAAATALGDIGTAASAKAVSSATNSNATVKTAAVDATLECAERYLAEGKNSDALALYKQLSRSDQPKHVRLAATRGMLACAGKKS
jgi:HEAT repeat protein